MKKRLVIITAILAVYTLVSGCSAVTGTAVSTAGKTGNTVVDSVGDASRYRPGDGTATGKVHYEKGEVLYFYKKTSFPDGTLLQTQLFKDGKPEPWWPASEYIEVRDGFWEVAVRLGENGVPRALEICPYYTLAVNEKDNPLSPVEKVGFDLLGPPAEIYAADEAATGKIVVKDIFSDLCGYFSVSGRTSFPDGTVLRSQLYEGAGRATWWPADEDIKVQDGRWNISLHGENEKRAGPLPGHTYTLFIREKGNSSAATAIRFDLVDLWEYLY